MSTLRSTRFDPRRLVRLTCLAAALCGCGGRAPAATPAPQQAAAGTEEACAVEAPRDDYVPTGYAGLLFALPPAYTAVHDPSVLTSLAIWIAPDSSVLVFGLGESPVIVDEDVSVVQREGRCRLSVAQSPVWVELSRVITRDGTDSVFGGRTAIIVDSLLDVEVAVVGRTRQERARLLGVLGAAQTRN